VRGEEFIEGFDGLNVRPVVDELPDRDPVRHFDHAAEMITVPMRGDEMIDLGEMSILRRRHDALGIPLRRIGSEVPGIDEYGFAGRGNK
jgi:hypothetical protein